MSKEPTTDRSNDIQDQLYDEFMDKELITLAKMIDLMLNSSLCNGQRWRMCEYLQDRFGRPEPPKD